MKYAHRCAVAFSAALLAVTSAHADLQEGIALFERKDYWSAAQEFIPLARADDGRAIYYLGVMSADGLGIAKNSRAGLAAFEDSARLGDAYGQNALGTMLLNGEGTAKDVPAAIGWFKKAMAQNNPKALVNMSQLYRRGEGVPQDDGMAVQLLRQATALDWPDAMVQLGHAYERGRGVAVDYAQARELYRRAGEQGDVAGRYHYVISAARKEGRGWLRPEELAWMASAADAGFAPAQAWLGYAYERSKDLKHAAAWYEKAALQGHVTAQFNLGLLFARGAPDVPQNEAEAARWFEKAAQQGDTDAQYRLAEALRQGSGVPRDSAASHRWYLAAAKAGDVPSMIQLAQLDEHPAEALGWLRRAAVQGHRDAQMQMGDRYKTGLGVPRNFEEARRWYTLAAKQGLLNAQSELNRLDAYIAYVAEQERKEQVARDRLAAEERRERQREREQARLAKAEAERRDVEDSRAFWRGLGQSLQNAGRTMASMSPRPVASTVFVPAEPDESEDRGSSRELGAILTRTDNGDAAHRRARAEAVADADLREQRSRAELQAAEARRNAATPPTAAARCVRGESCDVSR